MAGYEHHEPKTWAHGLGATRTPRPPLPPSSKIKNHEIFVFWFRFFKRKNRRPVIALPFFVLLRTNYTQHDVRFIWGVGRGFFACGQLLGQALMMSICQPLCSPQACWPSPEASGAFSRYQRHSLNDNDQRQQPEIKKLK